MPNWNQILDQVRAAGSPYDIIRRQYVAELKKKTGRNVIVYYSGWLQKPGVAGIELNDEDKNGFMTVIHEMDRSLGLDLVLHTPGGDAAATESLVDYLRSMFDNNIRSIVPQLAMSAGTMVACASNEIVMGKESSLGPIDPQFNGIPAHGVVEEFKRALNEIKSDPNRIPVWQPIIAKYNPTFIDECEKAIQWSTEMTTMWLESGMFANDKRAREKVKKILDELSDHALTKSHNRHLSFDRCKDIGLNVVALEDDPELQEAVLSVHHACILTLSDTGAIKIIENHMGRSFFKIMHQNMVLAQQQR